MRHPFHAPNQAANIIKAYNAKFWLDSVASTAGTLTQSVSYQPVKEYAGFMLCAMTIIGNDTDADNAESVTFAESFVVAPSFLQVNRHTGGGTTFGFNNLSTTGFDYDLPGSNNTLSWVAYGAVLVAL